jgi:hypothetical protein
MLKKISVIALAGLLSLPVVASADEMKPSAEELQQQIEKLTRELGQLRAQMEEMKSRPAPAAPAMAAPGVSGQQIGKLQSQIDETAADVAALKDKSESWDLASRIQLDGDFRSRIDYSTADTPSNFEALSLGQGIADTLAGAPAIGNIVSSGGITTVTGLFAALGPALGSQTAFETALTTAGASQQSATALFFIFSHPETQALLGQLAAAESAGAGSQLSKVTGAFSGTLPLVGFMKQLSPAALTAIFTNMGYPAAPENTFDNDTLWTNRLRLNMRVKATENVTFKGRLAMYKAWGMLNNPVDYQYNNGLGGGPYMLSSLAFDGSSTRQPQDNVLRVDRAYVNWANIADLPIWFSIGRRPTTDGPPAQLRQGLDERMATPTAYMDYPFDGLTLGYAYDSLFGIDDFPGRIRFCYGRGFESGPLDNTNRLRDVDFAGISWDVYNKGSRFFGFQAFEAFDMFNVPDNVIFPNPVELGLFQLDPGFFDPLDPNRDLILNRANLGNIYHTTAVYMDKVGGLNYFLAGGWSHTDPHGIDELGTGLLSSFNVDDSDLDSQDGFSVYAGIRYDMPDYRLKLGLEYNYGSKYWIAFTPGHDDMTLSKLATRGHVAEAYMIYNLPAGEKISKYADFFMRLGYQHYIYDYTGRGFWLGEPVDIDELASNPLFAQFFTPVENLDQVYLSLDTYF